MTRAYLPCTRCGKLVQTRYRAGAARLCQRCCGRGKCRVCMAPSSLGLCSACWVATQRMADVHQYNRPLVPECRAAHEARIARYAERANAGVDLFNGETTEAAAS